MERKRLFLCGEGTTFRIDDLLLSMQEAINKSEFIAPYTLKMRLENRSSLKIRQ